MSESNNSENLNKQCDFEQLEDRRVFSGQSIADIAVETQVTENVLGADSLSQIEVTTASLATDAISDARYVENEYGFDGSGQTVAVIDSGIAWDHYALGGGLGAGHRVVGGWDFAENDADPYDDGGAGFHGTHVSGIIGSSDETYRGVSSGVDLVGLRVFDDAGAGKLEWVESALRWVHEHKDDFENPITTVNLSLGTEWNSSNVPEWATLEDEFAQLKADGIFVSVAAGNAFENYNQAGLSYPAVSEHVVPVASHGADGNLSDFSQRSNRVLVAPGESIKSTVPDHLFGGTQSGAFAGSSGTSMAAPYVAGASSVARQALEFMGYDDINQDAIYKIFRDTADSLYDAVTNDTYDRLNLRAAIDAIIGDAHGDSFANAKDIGTVLNHDVIRGTIGKVTDADAFEFTATHTGRITFDIQASHDLVANFELEGGAVSVDGNQVSFDVQQGQQYKFLIRTANGIGHYQIDTTVTEQAGVVPTENWGSVDHLLKSNVAIANGEEAYQFTASRSGILTLIAQTDSGAQFKLYDQNMVEHQATVSSDGQVRFDVGAQAGQTFIIKAVGQGDFDVSVSNLVSLQDGNLSIHGTDANDTVVVGSGDQFNVHINSVNYHFNRDSVKSIDVDTGAGFDKFHLYLGDTNDNVTLGHGTLNASNDQFNVSARNTEQLTALAGGGQDQIRLEDSAGNDIFYNHGDTVAMLMDGMANYGVGFDFVQAVSQSGTDSAYLSGSEGDDKFVSRNDTVRVDGEDLSVRASGFDRVGFDGSGGRDLANIYDSQGNDYFVLRSNEAYVTTDDTQLYVGDVERINGFASTGHDTVIFYDSIGDDTYTQRETTSSLGNGSYANVAHGFDVTTVNSIGGYDVAQLSGSVQSDVVNMYAGYATLSAGNDHYTLSGFERTNVVATEGGHDVAYLHGTEGTDSVYADAVGVSLSSNGLVSRAVGFDAVNVDGRGGADQARLVGSSGNDRFTANRLTTTLDTEQASYMLQNFEQQSFDGGEGLDVVALSGFDQNDQLKGEGKTLNAKIGVTDIAAENFSFLDAATDLVSNYDMAAADYLFMLDGDWEEIE